MSGVPFSDVLRRQFTAVVGELNGAVFSQNGTTIVFAIVTLPLVFCRSIENVNKIYLLLLLSVLFFIYAWLRLKERTRQVYLRLLNRRAYLFVYIYYGFALIVMSSVLFSGSGGTVGMLRGRWYGALYIFFPVATAVIARLTAYAVYKHDKQPN